MLGRRDGEGAAAWTSTTHRHGPLPTTGRHPHITVTPGLTRRPVSFCIAGPTTPATPR